MATFTPDHAFISLADLVGAELARVKPFGIDAFVRSYGYDRLVGTHVHFSGRGPDHTTELQISYIKPTDSRATDAVTCDIRRGTKIIYVDHYLSNSGCDATFMSNFRREPSAAFIVAAIAKFDSLDSHPELVQALAGGNMADVPFDYGDNR
jgi:hypothetical protein